MPSTYWIELVLLLTALVLFISAALQAGGPRAWSWRRFGVTTLLVAALLSSTIVIGVALNAAGGWHVLMLVVLAASVLSAILVTALALLQRRGRGVAEAGQR